MDMKNVDIFARRQIEENRRQKMSRMPVWLKERRNAFRDGLIEAAKKSFEETGIWFLARGAGREKDEQETMAVWGDLLTFCNLEELPYYSKENHRRAIEFWQSWQNLETGRLYNPLYQDPQHPEIKRATPGNRDDYSAETINSKYIPGILDHLGAELPLACKIECCSDNDVDTFDRLWEHVARWESSPAGNFPVNAAREVEKGNLEKIPQVEAGMGALIRGYSRETGMWCPHTFENFPLVRSYDRNTGKWCPATFENFPWPDYFPSAGFKIISRLCGYVGMENFPEDILKTSIDNLLAHKEELLLARYPAQPRNYGEMMAHRLMLTDYRHDELLDAMEYCLEGFRDKKLWENTETSGYCLFGSGLIGVFMNWEDDMPMEKAFSQLFRFEHGCEMKYRFVAGPFGNWINVMPKEPEAVFGHPEYDMNKYGLKARNKAHWSKKVTDLIPQQEIDLDLSDDGKTGKGIFRFTLTEDQLAMRDTLYFKATWNGAYDVSLNGEPVKQVRYNLPDLPAGWYIPESAAQTLHVGENTVEIKFIGPGKDQKPGAPLSKEPPFIRLGLIDWS